MSKLGKKVAYLKGLAEGLGVKDEDNQGKLILALIDTLEAFAEENEELVVGKVNVDEEMELAIQFGVTSIPTLVVMKDGAVAATAVGYRPKADILKLLDV